MKFMLAFIAAVFLRGCATDEPTMLPHGSNPTSAPWGYVDMCDDPARTSEIHCPPKDTTDDS